MSGYRSYGRSAYPKNDECRRKCCPDDERHGICLPDEECQGIWLLGAAYALRTQKGMENGVRTTPATAARVQTQLSSRLRSDAAVTALKIAAKPYITSVF